MLGTYASNAIELSTLPRSTILMSILQVIF